MADVRVRFSPAPTGYLHVGGARAALFNWLYARHTGGTFVLRIEDTDAHRSEPHLVEAIYDSMRWLGLDWDEEYRQSDRFGMYLDAAEKFFDAGQAYYCDCSPEAVKQRAADRGETDGGYDGHCRDRQLDRTEGAALRFRTPDDGVTAWDDVIRGRVEFRNDLLEDFIIVRSNGVPMFHLANAVDDLDLAITHVVRGEDLVNTTPRVLLLRAALGATDQPIYAHLPLIVNEKRQKLSKRRDDVAVGDYRDRGFLPEAMRNYLATLGWGPPDEIEIRPIAEIVDLFELTDIGASPAFFDQKKLEHFNAEYIRALPTEEFIERAEPFYPGATTPEFAVLAPDVQARCRRLDEIGDLLSWIEGPLPDADAKDWRKVMGREEVPAVLDLVIERLADPATPWTAEGLESAVMGAGADLGVKSQLPVRMAVTHSRSGLPLFEPMAMADRDEIVARLRAARARL